MGSEVPPNSTFKEKVRKFFKVFRLYCFIVLSVVGFVFMMNQENEACKRALDITIQSMDFTVLNVTETRLSVNWDVLILIPSKLPGDYMCLNGNFQVFILYKGARISTSSPKSYNINNNHLRYFWEQQLSVSMIASEGDMDGGTMKDIMEVIKNKGEIQFGSRLIVPDCRRGTSGKMKYECDEATLRFGSERDATLFGNYPNCRYVH